MAIVYRCLNCGAELLFNAETQNWTCEYCDAAYNLSELEAAGKADVESNKKQVAVDVDDTVESTDGTKGDMVMYRCSHCNAEIITDVTTSATTCAYCNNPIVLSGQLTGKYAVEGIIPFKYTKEDAVEAYLKFCKKPLTPRVFISEKNLKRITGIYIPFWLYDCGSSCSMRAEGTKVMSWRAGDYMYTKTDVYDVRRAGSLAYSGIPTDASSKTDDAIMDSIEPYDYEKIVPFSAPFLAGYLAERFDIEEQTAIDRVYKRVQRTTEKCFRDTIEGYATVNVKKADIHMAVRKKTYVLLPVWILHTKYKEKEYVFAMNGQSGKVVGNLPIDKKRAVGHFSAAFGIAFLVMALINLIMYFF